MLYNLPHHLFGIKVTLMIFTKVDLINHQLQNEFNEH